MSELIREAIDGLMESQLSVPLAKTNEGFKPTLLNTWARSTLLPSVSVNLTRGPTPLVQDRGLYQLDVFVPTGSGTSSAGTMITTLIDYLYKNRVIPITGSDQDIQVVTVWEEQGNQEQDWFSLRLMLTYESIKKTI
jgi:hypothetical protein